jgi:hypothetical protein
MTGLEILGAIGTGLSAVGTVAGGIAQSNANKAQAEAAERQAQEVRAASQREAMVRAKETRELLSRQQAVAASSGGGATDSSVLDIMGDVAEQGQFNVDSAIFEGESQGRNLEDQAAILRWEGRQKMLSGFVDAGSSVLSGVSGFNQNRALTIGAKSPKRKPFPSFLPGS